MRRKDREVTDKTEILSWLHETPVARLGFAVGNEPYVIPLNFGILATSPLTLVFHSAANGRKLDMMGQNPRVCFEADIPGELKDAGEIACRWGMTFRSVIGYGTLEKITNDDEKRSALEALMRKYSSRTDWRFEPAEFKAVTLLKLRIDELSAKQKL